jgi:hypothetical protein
LELQSCDRIQTGKWLIQEQQFRFCHAGTQESRALAQSAGELIGEMAGMFLQAEIRQQIDYPLSRRTDVAVSHANRQQDVFYDTQPGEEQVILGHVAQPSGSAGYRLALEKYLSRIGFCYPGQKFQKGAFPTSAATHDADKTFFLHAEIQVLQYQLRFSGKKKGLAEVDSVENLRHQGKNSFVNASEAFTPIPMIRF